MCRIPKDPNKRMINYEVWYHEHREVIEPKACGV